MNKHLPCSCLSLLALSELCLATPVLTQTVLAQTVLTQTAIETTPSSLTLTGSHCPIGNCVQHYTLAIQPSAAIANLEVIALPLTRADGLSRPTAIRPVQLANTQIPANRVLSIPLEFDPNLLPSGEFKGDLLLTHQGGSQKIPMVVQVKDYWFSPLMLLVAGVILGMLVSAYRERGQPRDQLILRIGQLRSQMLTDVDFNRASAFQEWIQDHLIDVETALQNRQFAVGSEAIAQAESLWNKWRKGRADWLELMGYQETLMQQINQWGINTAFGQTAARQLKDVAKNMPQLDSPEPLRDQLEAIAKQIYQYAKMMPKVTRLETLVRSLPTDETSLAVQSKSQELQQKMNQMQPINVTDLTTLSSQLNEQINQMLAIEQQLNGAIATATELAPVSRGMEKVGRGTTAELFAEPFIIAPATRPLSLEKQIQKANLRLRLFLWTSYAIAVTFLAGAGFIELYADKPAFGAMPWRDYFSLLAWGFGAEATRDAVTKTVRNWQLPGIPDNSTE